MLCAAHCHLLPCAGCNPHQLHCPRGQRQMRCLRPVRGELSAERRPSRTEALRPASKRGPSRRHAAQHALEQQTLQRRLPREPNRRDAGRHCALQIGLPGTRTGAGIHPSGFRRPLRRGAGTHQKGNPLPSCLRKNLQQEVRGSLYPRRDGRPRCHR